jgi:PIN domain nuclease of toxin-antitoxin system
VALPLSPETAVAAARLPEEFPGDPADRMITASALENRSPVVSKDARLRGWSGLRTIW